MINQHKPHKSAQPHLLAKLILRWLLDHLKPMKRVAQPERLENENGGIRVWRIGHATLLIDFYGSMVLTDPVMVNWIPFPRRVVACPYSYDEIPRLDLILVSHAHFDHLNRPTLKQLAHKTKTIVIPKNCSDLVEGLGFKDIVEVDWNHQIVRGEISIHAVRPEHWGQRVQWEKTKRHYNVYVMERNGKRIFFGGDSGYGPFYKEIEKRHGSIDIALLGIGAYFPDRLLRVHQNPEQAVNALLDMNATHMIPMHYNDFRLSLEPFDEPEERLRKAAERERIADRIHILGHGRSITID
jgi:L-ascorbate metabolism protein UlaG (beta-lactamase superfamily)